MSIEGGEYSCLEHELHTGEDIRIALSGAALVPTFNKHVFLTQERIASSGASNEYWCRTVTALQLLLFACCTQTQPVPSLLLVIGPARVNM